MGQCSNQSREQKEGGEIDQDKDSYVIAEVG